MQWKLTGRAWVKDPQADKPDTDALPSILGGSLSFLASKRAPHSERLPHPALTRRYHKRGFLNAESLLGGYHNLLQLILIIQGNPFNIRI